VAEIALIADDFTAFVPEALAHLGSNVLVSILASDSLRVDSEDDLLLHLMDVAASLPAEADACALFTSVKVAFLSPTRARLFFELFPAYDWPPQVWHLACGCLRVIARAGEVNPNSLQKIIHPLRMRRLFPPSSRSLVRLVASSALRDPVEVLLDRDRRTYWSSGWGDPMPQLTLYFLRGRISLQGYELWSSSAGRMYPKVWRVLVSGNGQEWVEVDRHVTLAIAGDGAQAFFPLRAATNDVRYVRFELRQDSEGGRICRLAGIELYGKYCETAGRPELTFQGCLMLYKPFSMRWECSQRNRGRDCNPDCSPLSRFKRRENN
jgi:hypothetical protein